MKIPFIHSRARALAYIRNEISRGNDERSCSVFCRYGCFIPLSFFSRHKAYLQKGSEYRRVDFYMSHGGKIDDRPREWTLCRGSISRFRRAMSFWRARLPKLRLRSFSLPEALYGGNAIYGQPRVCAAEKKHAHARARFAPGRHGVN